MASLGGKGLSCNVTRSSFPARDTGEAIRVGVGLGLGTRLYMYLSYTYV